MPPPARNRPRDRATPAPHRLRAGQTPELAGLTTFGGERRVPGLRREEVAQLAGISTAYYTRMERGDLARTASGSRVPRRTKPTPQVSARLSQLLDTMGEVPALVLTQLGDPIASNPLGRALFPHIFPDGAAPLNHSRYLFLDPRSRTFYLDWETGAREAPAEASALTTRLSVNSQSDTTCSWSPPPKESPSPPTCPSRAVHPQMRWTSSGRTTSKRRSRQRECPSPRSAVIPGLNR